MRRRSTSVSRRNFTAPAHSRYNTYDFFARILSLGSIPSAARAILQMAVRRGREFLDSAREDRVLADFVLLLCRKSSGSSSSRMNAPAPARPQPPARAQHPRLWTQPHPNLQHLTPEGEPDSDPARLGNSPGPGRAGLVRWPPSCAKNLRRISVHRGGSWEAPQESDLTTGVETR